MNLPNSIQVKIKIIASLIVSLFQNDNSQPTDPGGWQTPRNIQDIINEIIVKDRNFEGAAALGEEIAKQSSQDPILYVLAQINIFNGLRRIPNGQQDALNIMSNQIFMKINAIPDGPRKLWLKAMHMYNTAIFLQDQNDFISAAAAHTKAVEAFKKLGDLQSVAISDFMTQMNILQAAIIDGQKEYISDMFSKLESLYNQLLPTMQNHGWEINFHLNMLMVVGLLNDFEKQCWKTISSYFEENGNSLQANRPHWWELFQLAKLVAENGDTSEAIKLAQKICENMEASRQADTTLTAALVGARMAKDDAYQRALFLGIIYNYNGLKGHVPRAIAAREFPPNT